MMQTLARLSTMPYHAEVVLHDRTPRTAQRCGPGEPYTGKCTKVATRSPKPCAVGSIPNCPCQGPGSARTM